MSLNIKEEIGDLANNRLIKTPCSSVWIERWSPKPEVTGSTPVKEVFIFNIYVKFTLNQGLRVVNYML